MRIFLSCRKAFEDLDLIPSEILWRPKEAFSDGVATKKKSLFEYMQEHAESQVPDDDLKQASTLYPMNTPQTKEAYLYRYAADASSEHTSAQPCSLLRSIFNQLYPHHEHLTPYMWLPKWCGDQTDPSARMLKHYSEQQRDAGKSNGTLL